MHEGIASSATPINYLFRHINPMAHALVYNDIDFGNRTVIAESVNVCFSNCPVVSFPIVNLAIIAPITHACRLITHASDTWA
jgi:hypothetical protein